MAISDMFSRIKDSVKQKTDSFLRGGSNQQYGYGQEPAYGYEQQPYGYSYEQAQTQQAQPQYTQQPQQDPYGYNYQDQMQAQYQAQSQSQSPYAGSYAQSQGMAPQQGYSQGENKFVQFPGAPAGGYANQIDQPQANTINANMSIAEAMILQLRDKEACMNVIGFLKSNGIVLLNMDSITNESEKQRCVDIISGAVFTLNCSMKKISSKGVYLVAPSHIRVEMDEPTQRINGANAGRMGQRSPRSSGYTSRYAQPHQEERYDNRYDQQSYTPSYSQSQQPDYGYDQGYQNQAQYQNPYQQNAYQQSNEQQPQYSQQAAVGYENYNNYSNDLPQSTWSSGGYNR